MANLIIWFFITEAIVRVTSDPAENFIWSCLARLSVTTLILAMAAVRRIRLSSFMNRKSFDKFPWASALTEHYSPLFCSFLSIKEICPAPNNPASVYASVFCNYNNSRDLLRHLEASEYFFLGKMLFEALITMQEISI